LELKLWVEILFDRLVLVDTYDGINGLDVEDKELDFFCWKLKGWEIAEGEEEIIEGEEDVKEEFWEFWNGTPLWKELFKLKIGGDFKEVEGWNKFKVL
jgi:hypothetical protein